MTPQWIGVFGAVLVLSCTPVHTYVHGRAVPQESLRLLHEFCVARRCAEGQQCLRWQVPGEPDRYTCEVVCWDDSVCPSPLRCVQKTHTHAPFLVCLERGGSLDQWVVPKQWE